MIDMNAGTTANTGGATSPARCASIGSFVAAAYAAIRSRVTSNVSGSLHRPIASDRNATALDTGFGTNGCQFIGGDAVTVAVKVTYAELIFPIFGPPDITVTQRGTAVVAAGTD